MLIDRDMAATSGDIAHSGSLRAATCRVVDSGAKDDASFALWWKRKLVVADNVFTGGVDATAGALRTATMPRYGSCR